MFTDVMVDIETTGTSSFDHTAILQIAGVKFNYDTQEVSPDMFNMSLSIPHGRYWDKQTEAWWHKDKLHVLRDIQARAQPPEVAMRAFYNWLLKDYPTNPDGLRFWAKPPHFDYSFIASYFRQFNMDNPCAYNKTRCLNSTLAALRGSADHWPLENEIEFQGDQHNALMDALHQVRVLFAAINKTSQSEYL